MFGSRLRYLREYNNLKQKDLAAVMDVTQRTISNYENDVRFPDSLTLIKIANYFNVSIDYLLERQQTLHLSSNHNSNKTNGQEIYVNSLSNGNKTIKEYGSAEYNFQLSHLTQELRTWVEDESNVKYIHIAKKLKDNYIDPDAIEQLIFSIKNARK